MKSYYPLFLSLETKEIVVIGGGPIAERKLNALIPMAANILVVSPEVTDAIAEMVNNKHIHWIQDTFKPKYVEKAFYIISATNDVTVSQRLKSSVRGDQLITYADDMENSTAILPAVVQRGGLIIAISTSGASPTLASRIKTQLEETYNEDYEEYLDFLFHARKLIKLKIEDLKVRKKLLVELVDHPQYRGQDREYLLHERLKQALEQKE